MREKVSLELKVEALGLLKTGLSVSSVSKQIVKYHLAKFIFFQKNTLKNLIIQKNVLPLRRNLRESF